MRQKLTVWIPPLTAAALRAAARRGGQSLSECAAGAIERGLQPSSDPTAELVGHAAARSAAALARVDELAEHLDRRLDELDRLAEKRLINALKLMREPR